MKNRAGPVAIG